MAPVRNNASERRPIGNPGQISDINVMVLYQAPSLSTAPDSDINPESFEALFRCMRMPGCADKIRRVRPMSVGNAARAVAARLRHATDRRRLIRRATLRKLQTTT